LVVTSVPVPGGSITFMSLCTIHTFCVTAENMHKDRQICLAKMWLCGHFVLECITQTGNISAWMCTAYIHCVRKVVHQTHGDSFVNS